MLLPPTSLQISSFFDVPSTFTSHEVKFEMAPPTYLSDTQCIKLLRKTLRQLAPNKKKITTKLLNKLLIQDSLNGFSLSPYFLILGANPNVQVLHPFSKDQLPLIYSMLSLQNLEGSSCLIANKKMHFFYTKGKYVISLLHSAILQGKINIINNIFLLKKFPLNRINTPYHPIGNKGKIGPSETALSLSTRRFQSKIMEQLLSRRATIYQKNPDGENCLIKAVKHGSSAETLRFLFAQQEILLSQEKPTTLLHFLIKNPVMTSNEMIASVDILLENGSILDALNDEQNTPLHESVQQWTKRPDLEKISKYLLEKGADLLALDKKEEKLPSSTLTLVQNYCLALHNLYPQTISSVSSVVEGYLFGRFSAFIHRPPNSYSKTL